MPKTYKEFQRHWRLYFQEETDRFLRQETSYLENLLPPMALTLTTHQVLEIYRDRLGGVFFDAIQAENTIPSPLVQKQDTSWIKTTNMVGINVRTIGSFWNIMKYMLTVPASQQSVHILPIWEPGVVASLYGMSSWNINPEFYSAELAASIPQLNTVEKQLKVVMNLLHATGRIVGMDVIPHTDRYSEIVLANPHYFEWLNRKDLEIIDHRSNLHEDVQSIILEFLKRYASARHQNYPDHIEIFFSKDFPEWMRLEVLFGAREDYKRRLERRNLLIQMLYEKGYEPVPATMAPPYRGLEVDPSPAAKTIDQDGRIWRDYRITKPENMSRVFGPLTRYKLYERLEDNRNWEIDFTQPRAEVWQYVNERYRDIQHTYNFDFMRGDMSHVQMRSAGVPAEADAYYDIHKSIKNHIQRFVPYFAYFAETFLAPPNEMGYGDEVEHLLLSDADSTLGDLQSMVVGSERFLGEFAQYDQILRHTALAPNFTIMTADKDDPRFDEFYLKGNEVRLFCGLFLTDMPSYVGLGFELRDPHPTPAPNEHYTKLYVFQEKEGSKATHHPYVWGENGELFHQLSRIRTVAERILPEIFGQAIEWLIPPDKSVKQKWVAWEVGAYVFLANFDLDKGVKIIDIEGFKSMDLLFSTFREEIQEANILQAGEGRILKKK
ncbi:MAG: hypothetical protein AAFO82_03135 [Bacteroidota bacterium]